MSEATPDKTIFRRRSRYTSISNTPLRHRSLTLDAVGFLACIMSLPEDWSFNRSWARKRFDIGKDKLERIIKELVAAGYVRREQERDAVGRMAGAVYVFTDEPGDFGDDTDGGLTAGGFPADGQSAATKDLPSKNENIEPTKGHVGKNETRTAAKASGNPDAGEKERGALDAQNSQKRASSEAGSDAETMRKRLNVEVLNGIVRTLKMPASRKVYLVNFLLSDRKCAL